MLRLLLAGMCAAAASALLPAQEALWPAPASVSGSGNYERIVNPASTFFVGLDGHPTLIKAAARYSGLTFPHNAIDPEKPDPLNPLLTALHVVVNSNDESHPQLGTNEAYTLSVPAEGAATLTADTYVGVLRGLETFSQLVVFDFDSATYSVPAPLEIEDSPRFPHRGLMIDTARHFEPLESIRRTLDSMAYAKLNVLHWHLVDTQSFPFQSTTYPKLWEGSFSGQERYLQADIHDIVEYARERGIRVMPEFDMPGHAESWCEGYPEICPSTTCLTPLDVANNATFDLVESLLRECTGGARSARGAPSGLFPEDFFHLGGDEVSTECWLSVPEVAAWLSERDLSADEAYFYFVDRAAAIARSQGRRAVQWDEVWANFGTDLNKDNIIHVWREWGGSETAIHDATAAGYNLIVNVGYRDDSWYLDNLEVMWDKVYGKEICAGISDEQCGLVLGGHGEMWGETVDASDLDQTIWPRMAAIAERLWSPRDLNDADAALPRLHSFRCLLNRRGVAAAPVLNKMAREAPGGPGSCYEQR